MSRVLLNNLWYLLLFMLVLTCWAPEISCASWLRACGIVLLDLWLTFSAHQHISLYILVCAGLNLRESVCTNKCETTLAVMCLTYIKVSISNTIIWSFNELLSIDFKNLSINLIYHTDIQMSYAKSLLSNSHGSLQMLTC